MLRAADGYVSGQQICDRFHVSRTAVWKVIEQLKEEGYEIEPEYPEENREWSHAPKMNANILVILHSELTVHILNMIWIIRN